MKKSVFLLLAIVALGLFAAINFASASTGAPYQFVTATAGKENISPKLPYTPVSATGGVEMTTPKLPYTPVTSNKIVITPTMGGKPYQFVVVGPPPANPPGTEMITVMDP